jgi:uncharacterized protein YkwD
MKRFFLCPLAVLLLASCGGGGDSTPAPSPGSGFQPTNPGATTTCNLPNFSAAALARVNQWRASGAQCGSSGTFAATTALSWSDPLTQAAAAHSLDMQTNNFVAHTGSNGSTIGQRITAVGYAWSGVAENIAAGQTSVESVIDGWIASPGHCANIMNPSYVHLGLACVPGGTGNTYTTYWTMTLGRPQ